jgi:hypothetical protein
MKKIMISVLLLLLSICIDNKVLAQNKYEECANAGFFCGGTFGKFAIQVFKNKNWGPTEPIIKNLVVDEKFFYVFQSITCVYDDGEGKSEKNQYYNTLGLWKSSSSTITGIATLWIDSKGKVKARQMKTMI